MSRTPGFPVTEIRGRLLHEALLAEARSSISAQDWHVETIHPPDFPVIATTDTGSMRAVVVAS